MKPAPSKPGHQSAPNQAAARPGFCQVLAQYRKQATSADASSDPTRQVAPITPATRPNSGLQ